MTGPTPRNAVLPARRQRDDDRAGADRGPARVFRHHLELDEVVVAIDPLSLHGPLRDDGLPHVIEDPHAERPYKAFGYPVVPILYILGATVILVVLFIYQTATTWPGLIIVLTGVPVYFFWNKSRDRKIGLDNIDSPSRTGTNT